jgi:Subtilisin inhibitor-like
MEMRSELQQSAEPHGTSTRGRGVLARGALIAGCGILAAACGSTVAPASSGPSGSSGPSSPSSSTSAAGTTSAAKVSLNIVLTAGKGVTARRWTLRCDPAGGNYPNPAAACAKLSRLQTILYPSPVHVMCPMIMADASSYLVYGTILGKKVHETIPDGGCSLSRWNELKGIFN